MKSLVGHDRDLADRLLEKIQNAGTLEFVGTNEDRDFVDNCQRMRHIHWPLEWLRKLSEISDKLGYNQGDE
jgi:hypothetical protein